MHGFLKVKRGRVKMSSVVEEKVKAGGLTVNGSCTNTLLEEMKLLREIQDQSGARKAISSELWHACAGPLVSLPQMGSLVYYFPQGHSEQVAVSTKRSATSQIPNYPNLPSQLMCQVHNVTLHADKETDEIYAQMSLQPVNSEKDMFPIPDFGLKQNKHPTEFFCKTLTASDTSTHGGFSVPRRAAEKLFPALDYSMQPPTQELVVRDLHDNSWTFRHIYRGQPKRHLLTTGWSLFVGAKRLRAGDSVLFIRDEKSQLMVGVRRANRQQTTLPSSVLSADSMHIGVLAAAAHAAANRSPFTIFYNPRACPSEFVIPLAKYRKSVYGSQISVGMRFGMMFETEESSKRRYMGTIVNTSDLDPIRWPGSKWRNIQVEWDESGCSDKPNRVSSWEIETPESLFIFPSLTTGLKRPINTGLLGAEGDWGGLVKRPFMRFPDSGYGNVAAMPNQYSEQLMKMLMKPQVLNNSASFPPNLQELTASVSAQDVKPMEATMKHGPQLISSETTLPQNQHHMGCSSEQSEARRNLAAATAQSDSAPALVKSESKAQSGASQTEKSNLDSAVAVDQFSQLASTGQLTEEKSVLSQLNQQNLMNQLTLLNQSQGQSQQTNPWLMQQHQLESLICQSQQTNASQADSTSMNGLLPCFDGDEWMLGPSTFPSLGGILRSPASIPMYGLQDSSTLFPEVINPAPLATQEIWDQQLNNARGFSQPDQLPSFPQQHPYNVNSLPGSNGLKDLSDDSNNHSGIYSCLNMDNSNAGSALVDHSVSSTVLDDFCTLKETNLPNPSDCFVGNFNSSQDVQSQITSASLADSKAFCRRDFTDNSGGTSSSNVEYDESSLLQSSSWQQVAPPPPVRTYTKVQKAGSVGRSIDVTNFKNYEGLCSAIERMFGLEGLLNDPKGSAWKLVYVDYENDVLLVGDDPWEEFVGCVRCIRILSPSEVQQMSEEGMQLLNSTALQGFNNASVPDGTCLG